MRLKNSILPILLFCAFVSTTACERLNRGYDSGSAVSIGAVGKTAQGEHGEKGHSGEHKNRETLDSDNDGIPDAKDECPGEAEDKDGFEDDDGCPEEDNDNDGIPDVQDKCPNEAEDKDGFQDDDGCPEIDNDGDGIPDTRDKCPNEAETRNGYLDEDGCPEPDKDEDGIPDAIDKCPDKPETINGFNDDDGCPDKGKTKIKVTETKIEISENVYFQTGNAKISRKSYNLLDQIVSVLKRVRSIDKLMIEGFTDNVGNSADNLKLSQERADAIRNYLITKGISPARLVAKGFGAANPIASNDTRKGRESNRRVEFLITELNGKPVRTDSIKVTE